MLQIIGFIVTIALWSYTLKTIMELNKVLPIKIAFVIGILIFPFVGVLYAVYNFIKKKIDQ